LPKASSATRIISSQREPISSKPSMNRGEGSTSGTRFDSFAIVTQ
jgi:hypothetical protein